MQPGAFWLCAHCGSRNKGYAAVCLACGRDRRAALVAPAAVPSRAEPARAGRAVRWYLAAALVLGVSLAVVLVRTFRSPALASQREEAAVAAAEAVRAPETETAPPVPFFGLGEQPPRPAEPAPGGFATEAAPPPPEPAMPPPTLRSYTPSAPAPPRRSPRVYTDEDLAAYAARRPREAPRDPDYRLALRQRRVRDLRERLAAADSADERAKLREWLEGALRDLEEAERTAARP